MSDTVDQLLVKLKRDTEQNDMHAASIHLEQLYVQFSDQFRSFAQRKGLSQEDTDEVLNDTFLSIYRGIHTYKENGKGAAWIWTICRHQTIDKIKERQKEKAIPVALMGTLVDSLFSSHQWGPVRISELNEFEDIFRRVWGKLSVQEQNELTKREHTRGTKGQKWEAAWDRFCTLFKKLHEDFQ